LQVWESWSPNLQVWELSWSPNLQVWELTWENWSPTLAGLGIELESGVVKIWAAFDPYFVPPKCAEGGFFCQRLRPSNGTKKNVYYRYVKSITYTSNGQNFGFYQVPTN
jgi:hypothetical protein